MSRKVLIIRHAKSVGGRHDKHLYPKEGAPLSDQGLKDVSKIRDYLIELGVDIESEPVAVSELIRTRQTAEVAGFKTIKSYSVLNEVNTGLSPEELERMLQIKLVPKEAIDRAKKLLENPPLENIWVTHGLLVAGLAELLRIPKEQLYIPDMASVTEITLT
ncbi:histidine phosphatase family protein [Candidatus Nomurabacteria bacterium]|nr:histidine phosphatase family protein [Candidatus Nomurabacteria bacterium]